ncbi:MAG: hypothetical protein ACI9E4_000189 [Pseudohongiellaceae bacterium]|jgi:hypothetical protein
MKSIKAKTTNGRPTSVAQLSVTVTTAAESNLEQIGECRAPRGLLSRLVSVCNKVNLVLAGMYTGVTCYGVPHEEHSYSERGGDDVLAKKPRSEAQAESK